MTKSLTLNQLIVNNMTDDKGRLTLEFFNRHCCEVAKDLLGQVLVFGKHKAIITETESYRGSDDPASHAFKGITPRTEVMFGPPGMSYVYLIYGMYYCLNITAESLGSPAAVLIRGIKLLDNGEILNGPGKICKYLSINKGHHNIDITKDNNFYIKKLSNQLIFDTTPRIGINKGQDKLWRYIIKLDRY